MNPAVTGLHCADALSTYCHHASDIADLAAIFEPDVQICYLHRSPSAALTAAIEAHRASAWSAFRDTLSLTASHTNAWGHHVPPALRQDIQWLLELYGDLIGCDAVGVRFEVLSEAMCPGFHVDQCGIRLICTYRGPGTEWALPGTRNWSATAAQATVEQATAFSIVLVKGGLWQGNAGRGGIHRSPALPAGAPPRLLLTLDALWNG